MCKSILLRLVYQFDLQNMLWSILYNGTLEEERISARGSFSLFSHSKIHDYLTLMSSYIFKKIWHKLSHKTFSALFMSVGIWFPWTSQPMSVTEHGGGVLMQTNATSVKDCMTQCMNTNTTVNSSCDYIIMSNTAPHDKCTLFRHAAGQSAQSFDHTTSPVFYRSPVYRGLYLWLSNTCHEWVSAPPPSV